MTIGVSGLAPVIDDKTRVLILGSMPGEESLLKQQYYARANNDFWKITGECLGSTLHGLPYEWKIALLLSHGVGLWDVYRHCDRAGSADSGIANAMLNDFARLRRDYPNLTRLLCNGKEAGTQSTMLHSVGLYDPHIGYKLVLAHR